jgi:hypothetical protein
MRSKDLSAQSKQQARSHLTTTETLTTTSIFFFDRTLGITRPCLELSEISPRRNIPHLRPDPIDRLHDLLRQWTRVANLQVLLQLVKAAGADDDGVAVLARQCGVVDAPAQSDGVAAEVVGFGCVLDLLRGCEDGGFVVA